MDMNMINCISTILTKNNNIKYSYCSNWWKMFTGAKHLLILAIELQALNLQQVEIVEIREGVRSYTGDSVGVQQPGKTENKSNTCEKRGKI